jgi:hypothetical protein
MCDETAAGFDFAPFAEPFPQMCGIDRIDIDNVKEWMLAKDDWEAIHGKPRGGPSHDA